MQEGDLVKIDLLVEHSGSRKSKEAWGRIKKDFEEPAQQPTNSDYAVALKVYHEYTSSGVSTIEHFVTFPSWCEEHLHSSTNIA